MKQENVLFEIKDISSQVAQASKVATLEATAEDCRCRCRCHHVQNVARRPDVAA
jgi:hypothetical protein